MRKALTIITVALFLQLSTTLAPAASTPTPSSSPSKTIPSDSLTKQITNLKEKIASRVAELKLVEKRGIIGVVTEVKDTQITLTDIRGDIRFIDVDELTKFTGSDSKAAFGISDIKKGTKLAILGRYNKESKRLLARFIDEITISEFVSGTIKEINSANFSFTLETADKKTIGIAVENTTKTQSYNKIDGVVKFGFSKFRIGDCAVVIGYPDKTDPARVVATRLLVLTDFRKEGSDNLTLSPTGKSSSKTTTDQK